MDSLKVLSVRLTETPSLVQAPPSAATRITHHPFTSQLHARWNQEVDYLFTGFREWDRRAQDWGKKLLYGTTGSSTSSGTDGKQSS
jgi:altered-inheritance-of-mitochondria protein 5